MRTLLLTLSLFLVSCSVQQPNQSTPSVVIPKYFDAPNGTLFWSMHELSCQENCFAEYSIHLKKLHHSDNWESFAAISLTDREQKQQINIEVIYKSQTNAFYFVVANVKDGRHIVEVEFEAFSSLPNVKFDVSWVGRKLSIRPYQKEVGDTWYMMVPSEEAVNTVLDFDVHSIGYKASGMAGAFYVEEKKQNVYDFSNPPNSVNPKQVTN